MTGRRRLLYAVVLALLPLSAVGSPPAGAQVAAAVQGLTLRGSSTPMEVVVSWTVVDRSTYGGARVLVTAGDLQPSGPDDPRAVAVIDVPPSALTSAWTSSTAGATFTVSVFARETVGTYAPAASGSVYVPGVVRHFVVATYRGARAEGAWVLPPGAESAILCYARTGAPTTLASAETCAAPDAFHGQLDTPGGFGTFSPNQFAAFARAPGTGVLGARSLVVGESPAPFPATLLTTAGAGADHIELQWNNGYQEQGYAFQGAGGTVTWLIYAAKGTASPASAGGTHAVEIPTSTDFRTTGSLRGLARNTTYTFALRGRDVEGNLSDWSAPLTTATRRPGFTMVTNAADGRWRRSRVPGIGDDRWGSAVVTTGGKVLVGAMGGDDERALLASRRPGHRWRTRSLVAAGYRHLTADARTGTVYGAGFRCIYSKRSGRGWRPLWCSDARVNEGVHSLVLDRRGRVHALADMLGGTFYVTNADSGWRVTALPDLGGSYVPLLRYDRRTDTLVLVSLRGTADEVRVAAKHPGASEFGPWQSWYRTPSVDQRVALTSAAAAGGRLVAAVVARTASGRAWGRPQLLTGPVTGTASAQPIRGAGLDSLGPLVALAGRGRLHVAWTWATPVPGDPAQGVWSSGGRWNADRHRWALTRPGRRSTSAYDQALDLDVDARGRAHLLVRTVLRERDRLVPG